LRFIPRLSISVQSIYLKKWTLPRIERFAKALGIGSRDLLVICYAPPTFAGKILAGNKLLTSAIAGHLEYMESYYLSKNLGKPLTPTIVDKLEAKGRIRI